MKAIRALVRAHTGRYDTLAKYTGFNRRDDMIKVIEGEKAILCRSEAPRKRLAGRCAGSGGSQMPYHVRIKTASDKAWVVKFDLTAEQLEKLVVAPYREGRHIVVSGRTIVPSEIYRIQVVETPHPSVKFHEYVATLASTVDEIVELEQGAKDVTDDFIAVPPGNEAAARETPRAVVDARNVFVVHGRDLRMRDELFIFLRAIGLQPVEFSRAARLTGTATPYIGDILDAAFGNAQAVIVLFTPDDEARLREDLQQSGDPAHERELTPQARANVLFEAGMAMGRNADRTVLVEMGTLRPVSDLGGRHVIRLNDSGVRRQELAQRLEVAGCPVNLTGTEWHTAGQFSLPAPVPIKSTSKAEALPSYEPSEEERAILSFLTGEEANTATSSNLANSLGMREQRARFHLDRLHEHELVEGGVPRWYVTAKGRALAKELGFI